MALREPWRGLSYSASARLPLLSRYVVVCVCVCVFFFFYYSRCTLGAFFFCKMSALVILFCV